MFHTFIFLFLSINFPYFPTFLICSFQYLSFILLDKHFQLNVHSALLWQELLDKCNITVKNTLTGQVEVVPVTVVLHGDASKAVLRGTSSLFFLVEIY